MLEVYWDPTLVPNAQSWAQQCNFEHNNGSAREANTSYWWVGQNLCISTAGGYIAANVSNLFMFWYNESKYYTSTYSPPVTNFTFSDPVGHYTQVVWANSEAIGCGLVSYSDTVNNHNYLVCNYGPGGNVVGAQMYIPGTFSGNLCTNGASKTYSNLCAPLNGADEI